VVEGFLENVFLDVFLFTSMAAWDTKDSSIPVCRNLTGHKPIESDGFGNQDLGISGLGFEVVVQYDFQGESFALRIICSEELSSMNRTPVCAKI